MLLSLTSLGAALAAAILAYVVYECFVSPLAAFPGPLAAKVTKAWRVYHLYKCDWHRELSALHERYGPVVRIGPNELSVGDPEAFRTIYRLSNPLTKAKSHSVLRGKRPFDLTNERDEKVHGAQRRLVARPYSMESMKRLEPHVDDLAALLLRKFDDAIILQKKNDGSAAVAVVDLGHWLQLFAFDVIGAVSFGKTFGFVEKGTDAGMFKRLEDAINSAAWIMHAPWFWWLHQNVILPVFGNFLAVNDRNGFFLSFAKEQVEKRRLEGGDRDIVGQFFQAQSTKSELTDAVIFLMMTTNVFAGSDTTAGTLRAIFLELLRKPETLAKLRDELEKCRCRADLARAAVYTSEEAEACRYLQAVMYEGMRTMPTVPLVMDRDVPPEGITIMGKYVPGGYVVGSSPTVIHQIKEIWGDDAKEFRPERWLDSERVGDLRRFFFGFGAGTRTCIGKNISWLEMEKLIATLVTRYDMQLADDADIQIKSRYAFTFSPCIYTYTHKLSLSLSLSRIPSLPFTPSPYIL
ncbi:cytochrome P450 family protein [Xylariaceae sp. FL0594]|nr:cytochrome P450 family protein [Xylariaceae sp. FL0594]